MRDDKPGICRLTSKQIVQAVNGGSYRGLALDEFCVRLGARMIECYAPEVMKSRTKSRLRVFGIIAELERMKPQTLILSYPIAFPYLCASRREMTKALLLATYLRAAKKRYVRRLIVDVGDLAFNGINGNGECADWWKPVEDQLRRLDDIVMNGCATEIWAASETFAAYLRTKCSVQVKSVVNGYFADRIAESVASEKGARDDVIRFVCCGRLHKQYGTAALISEFMAARAARPMSLYLLGAGGEWIDQEYSEEGITHLGVPGIDKTLEHMMSCDVALLPLPDIPYDNLTFPTKLGLAIGCGLPVIATPYGETGEFVKSMGIGIVEPLERFSSAIQLLSGDASLREQYAERVLELRPEYAWNRLYENAYGL